MELTTFLPAMVLMALIDAPWLLFTAKVIKDPFYTSGGQTRMWAAIPVYIALVYLLLRQTSIKDAFLTGAATYAVYDFTVLAVRSDFRLSSAILDTLWGGILFASTYKLLHILQIFK